TSDGFRLDAEKWFVTAGDVASVYVVMANVLDGAERLPTLFVVDRDRPGVEIAEDPAYTHNYPEGHPTVSFRNVELATDDVFGGRGYRRSNVAERMLRELRVDRIWEGTSEIQRLIVARGLERRGVERMLH